MTSTFTLPLDTVDVLWERLGLGLPVFPLDIPSNGATHAERAALHATVLADLERRGLARDGRVDPRIESALRTMATPEASVSAIGLTAGQEMLALAAMARERAVLAVQRDDRLSVDRHRPPGLVKSLLELLPDTSAGVGKSVTISAGPGGRSDKALARSYLERPRTAFGRLSVDGPQLAPFELNWFDTDRGRYICYRRTGQDGAAWVTYAPSDRRRMAHLLSEALKAFRTGGHR